MVDKRQDFFQGDNFRKDKPKYDKNPRKETEKIQFRDAKNHLRRELLVEEAEAWALRIANKVSYTQLRKFYSEALALKSKMEEKVKEKGKEEGFKDTEALIGMLISKANYSKIKSKFYKGQYEYKELSNFIYAGVTAVHSEQDFEDFVLFFEAVLGFYPRKK